MGPEYVHASLQRCLWCLLRLHHRKYLAEFALLARVYHDSLSIERILSTARALQPPKLYIYLAIAATHECTHEGNVPLRSVPIALEKRRRCLLRWLRFPGEATLVYREIYRFQYSYVRWYPITDIQMNHVTGN